MVQYPWWGTHPDRLLPASLSRLFHLGGAGGSTYGTVIHLHEEELWAYCSGGDGCYSNSTVQGSGEVYRKVGRWLPTLLTASVAMPSMAAPPTPSTSLALESMKSMAVPIPLSSFFPLRSPFTPAILTLKAEERNRLIETDRDREKVFSVLLRLHETAFLGTTNEMQFETTQQSVTEGEGEVTTWPVICGLSYETKLSIPYKECLWSNYLHFVNAPGRCTSRWLGTHLQTTCEPLSLHKPTQAAAEEELAPLQCVLLIFRYCQGLAAAKLASHSTAIVITVGVLKVTPCAEQRPVQLQHGTARPAAH